MVKDELRELEKKMKVSVEHFRKELSKMRTGRANISIFEDIKIDYYGSLTPVNQVATLGVPDPTLISIQPWDPNFLDAIDKSIRAADLGLNPINDGKTLKIPIPPLDVQKKIVKLDVLMREEGELLNTLAEKRKEMITATCFQALRKAIK